MHVVVTRQLTMNEAAQNLVEPGRNRINKKIVSFAA